MKTNQKIKYFKNIPLYFYPISDVRNLSDYTYKPSYQVISTIFHGGIFCPPPLFLLRLYKVDVVQNVAEFCNDQVIYFIATFSKYEPNLKNIDISFFLIDIFDFNAFFCIAHFPKGDLNCEISNLSSTHSFVSHIFQKKILMISKQHPDTRHLLGLIVL